MIEYLAGIIADKQIKNGRIAGCDRAIYQYGYILLMETGINIMISITLGILCHTLPEVFIFLLFFVPLRSYAGGWHMAHAWQCILITNVTILFVAVGAIYFSRYCPGEVWLVADILSCAAICVLSPIDTEAKPLEEEEKLLFRKKARMIGIGELLLNLILFFLNCNTFVYVISMSHMLLVLSLFLEKNNKTKNT